MRNKIIFIIIFLGLGYFLAVFLSRQDTQMPIAVQTPVQAPVPDSGSQATQSDEAENNSPNRKKSSATINAIKLDAPFIVQAPFGNWGDPIFQNACEEASIAMAMGWINGMQTISPGLAKKQISDIVNFENKTFGYNADTDVFDVQKIFQQYFKKQNVAIKENIVIVDIVTELQKGNLILVPAFGQALGNPNYTAPGPVEHMLVIIGYDPATKELITNDPGTRRGAGYRYEEGILFDAIWDNPSGAQAVPAPTGVLKKAMIVVQK